MLRKINRAMLQDPIVIAAPLQTMLNSRPVVTNIISPPEQFMDTTQKVCFALLVIPGTIGFFVTLFNQNWTGFFIASFFMSLMALALWIVYLRARMVWTVTWHSDRVEVEDGRYGPSIFWSEPLSAFSGLAEESARLGGSRSTVGLELHGLLLAHPDPEKHILLVSSGDKISEEAIAYYSRQLDKRVIN